MKLTNVFFIHWSSCEDYQQTCYNLAAIGDPVHACLLLASIRAGFPEHQRIFIFRQHHRYQYFINPFILYYVAIFKWANKLPILWKSNNKVTDDKIPGQNSALIPMRPPAIPLALPSPWPRAPAQPSGLLVGSQALPPGPARVAEAGEVFLSDNVPCCSIGRDFYTDMTAYRGTDKVICRGH